MILIFGDKSYETKRIYEELKKIVETKLILNRNLIFSYKLNLPNPKVAYFYRTGSIFAEVRIFMEEFKEKGTRIVDRSLEKGKIISKSYVYYKCKKKDFPFPESVKIRDPHQYKRVLNLGFPIVAKHEFMHRGEGVFLIKNEKELLEFIEKNKERLPFFIFQKYIPYEKDVRILIVGDKILGCMQRVNPTDFRANIARGGYGKEIKLNNEILNQAFELKEILDLDIAGVDVLITKDEYYFIEVNRSPRFQGFEKYVKKNVGKEIALFLSNLR